MTIDLEVQLTCNPNLVCDLANYLAKIGELFGKKSSRS